MHSKIAVATVVLVTMPSVSWSSYKTVPSAQTTSLMSVSRIQNFGKDEVTKLKNRSEKLAGGKTYCNEKRLICVEKKMKEGVWVCTKKEWKCFSWTNKPLAKPPSTGQDPPKVSPNAGTFQGTQPQVLTPVQPKVIKPNTGTFQGKQKLR